MTHFSSGGRSAVVPSEHCVYRLKGCGNFVNQEGFRYDFPGFPVQAVEVRLYHNLEIPNYRL